MTPDDYAGSDFMPSFAGVAIPRPETQRTDLLMDFTPDGAHCTIKVLT